MFFNPRILYCDTFPEVRGEVHHSNTVISRLKYTKMACTSEKKNVPLMFPNPVKVYYLNMLMQ